MISIITTLLSWGGTLFGYYISKTKNKEDLERAANSFFLAKSGVNESARDREDIFLQRERIKKLKEKQNENVAK